MGALVDYAKRELASLAEADDKTMYNDIMALLELLESQGHSGSSEAYCLDTFIRIANYRGFGPLTGEDDEWVPFCEGLMRNWRAPQVIKDTTTGKAYDTIARVFTKDGKRFYYDDRSKAEITFPYYVPSRPEFVTVEDGEVEETEEE